MRSEVHNSDERRRFERVDITHQAQVLVRHVASWEETKHLARIGVDLLSMVADRRDLG